MLLLIVYLGCVLFKFWTSPCCFRVAVPNIYSQQQWRMVHYSYPQTSHSCFSQCVYLACKVILIAVLICFRKLIKLLKASFLYVCCPSEYSHKNVLQTFYLQLFKSGVFLTECLNHPPLKYLYLWPPSFDARLLVHNLSFSFHLVGCLFIHLVSPPYTQETS